MKHRGFSLVELLVVLTIMSVLVGSISYVILQKEDTFKKVTQKIVQNLKLAQQRSIREQKVLQVEIDFAKNTFYFIDNAITLPKDTFITVKTAENQLLEKELVAITFYPDSSMSGGTITIETDQEVFNISMIWISGKISTTHYEKKR